ncbi:DEKNAAC102012 [Brettanomyces naardenensis]|uniref:Ribosome-recycling factor, mitochondrial n=1 Tax=Brettanomyces naardenensis TaxID=13370 RepID=A0A448YJF2_BRENA|nr:DEKNAAC102012 [Brettanomyces naardenensis]
MQLKWVTSMQTRSFTRSSPTLAKKKKSNKKGGNKKQDAQDEENEVVEEIDTRKLLKEAENEFAKSIELYNKRVTQVKMGRANPSIFDGLQIQLANQRKAKFQDVAQTTLKGGKYLTVTVFDPHDTKNVVSAILAANLNLNPEADPNNPQLLKVQLPNSTKEWKAKQLKELKELTDDFKTAHNNKSSLANLRGRYLKQIKDVDGSKDVIRKLETDIDKLFKEYATKLADSFKSSEKTLK